MKILNILKPLPFLILFLLTNAMPYPTFAANGVAPTPSRKPIAQAPIPENKPSLINFIEPSSGQKNSETTLVSFALKPNQVSLDENLHYFLEKHALDILNQDKNLTIHINAYAPAIEGEEYSDVRLSLARALEVRSFLIKRNIDASRLKLTPIGHAPKSGTKDRIDLIFKAKE